MPNKTLVTLTTIALLGSLTACTTVESASPIPEFDHLAVIVSTHANAQAPGIPQTLAPTIERAVEHGVPIAIIGLDGTPEVEAALGDYEINTQNPAARADDVAGITGSVVRAVRELTADSDGNDLGGAVFVARDAAKARGAAHPLVVIIDSGAADRGPVDLTAPGATIAEPEAIAAAVSGRLPDLSDTLVQLVGFGYTSGDQGRLAPRQQQNITGIWSLALTQAGATVTVIPEPRTGASPDTSFVTRTIAVAAEPAIAVGLDPLVYGDGSSLGFQAESAAFVDEGAARETIGQLAAWLAADPARRAQIVGTTARDGSVESQLQIAHLRTQAVRDALVAAGVGIEQIQTVAVGSDWPGYVPDHHADGTLNEAAAALNRTTQITLSYR